MDPLMKFMLIVIAFFAACFTAAWFSFPDVGAFSDNFVTPAQSVVFNPSTCTDIIENPITETIWGDVSNGYRCGHE